MRLENFVTRLKGSVLDQIRLEEIESVSYSSGDSVIKRHDDNVSSVMGHYNFASTTSPYTYGDYDVDPSNDTLNFDNADIFNTTKGLLENATVSENVLSTFSLTTWLVFTLLVVLDVVTIIGNVLVCLSVILVRKLRKPQNYLLVSLATSDLFVALFVMPFAIVFEINGGIWPLKSEFCDLWVSADVLCCTASILSLCAISCDRYGAITGPLEYAAKTTPRRMLAIIFLVWLGSACVSLPPLLLLGNVYEDSQGNPFCSVSQNFWYQIYATLASFYVPLLVMVVVYFKILRVVSDKKKMDWNRKHRASSCTANSSSVCYTNHSSPAKALLLATSTTANDSPTNRRSNSTPSVKTTTLSDANIPFFNPPNVSRDPIDRANEKESVLGSKGSGGMSTTTTSGLVATTVFQRNHLNPMDPRTVTLPSSPPSIRSGRSTSGFIHSTPPHRNRRRSSVWQNICEFGNFKKEMLFRGFMKEHKASTVLGIIMSAFIICWLPFFVLALLRPFLALKNIEIPDWVSSLFTWLGYANSSLNPVIYAILNRDFRKPFKEILCFRCSTLEIIMRRDFYNEQYGDDREYLRRPSPNHLAPVHEMIPTSV